MTDEQRDNLLLAMSKNIESLDKKIDSKYDSLDKKIDSKYDSLNEKIDNTYNSLNEKIDNTYNSLNEKIDNTYNSLNEKIDSKYDSLDKKIDSKYDSLDKKIDNTYDSLNEKIERYHKEALENHQTLVNILEAQRLSIVKLEYNLTDQIRALFDISDINNDKFKEHDAAIKEIQKRMDWHNRRLLKLETSN